MGQVPAVGIVIDPHVYNFESRTADGFTSQYLLGLVERLSVAGVPAYLITTSRLDLLNELPVAALQLLTIAPEFTLPAGTGFGVPVIHSARALHYGGPAIPARHDWRALVFDVMIHLRQQGARAPALIMRDEDTSHTEEVIEFYRQWCEEVRIQPLVKESSGGPEHMRTLARELASDSGADAMFSMLGEASSLVAGIAEAELSVPQDILVVSLGADAVADMVSPPASVLSLCAESCATRIADVLVAGLDIGEWPEHITLPYEFKIRQSSQRSQ